jgi:hypothetical protein
MTSYSKKDGSNLDRPDTILVIKFSEYQLDMGGLSRFTITQKGDTRMLHCNKGPKRYKHPLVKGDLIATGPGHVWVTTKKQLNGHYGRYAEGKS